MNHGRWNRVGVVVLAIVLSIASLACTPDATPTPTTTPIPPPPPTTVPPVVVSAISPITDVDVWLNVGAGIQKNADGTVDVTVWRSQLDLSPALTVTLWLDACRGEIITPTLVINAQPAITVPMTIVDGPTNAGTQYRAEINTAHDGVLESILAPLCDSEGSLRVPITVSWQCMERDPNGVQIGTLSCQTVPVEDPNVLRDPRGSAERPTGTCPGVGCTCTGVPGWKAQIFKVNPAQGPNTPVPIPGGADCPTVIPAGGWTWSPDAPTALRHDLLSDVSGWTPPDNEQMTTSAAVGPPAVAAGVFAWDAPSTATGCYFVRLSKPDTECDWFTPMFGLDGTNDIVNLNIDLLEDLPACDTMAPPCP